MILTAHQPGYLPWLGLFDKVARADHVVWLDHVQFEKNSFDNRNRIRTANGPTWLTVPVHLPDGLGTPLAQVQIVENGWRRKHVATLRQAYGRAPHFEEFIGPVEAVIVDESRTRLADITLALIEIGLRAFGIATPSTMSSHLPVRERKSELIIELCQMHEAERFIFGAQGRDYAELPRFAEAGITPEFQEYECPAYAQIHGEPFEPNLSFVDYLFNVGPIWPPR